MTLQQTESTDFGLEMNRLMQALPKPYVLLREGEEIFPGCLMGNPELGTWALIGAQYWNTRFDGGYIPMAAPGCPEGYRVAHGNFLTVENALIWRKSEQYWCAIPDIWKNLQLYEYWHVRPAENYQRYRNQPTVLHLRSTDAFICLPVEDSWRTTILPLSHRQLHVNDVVRKHDRIICAEVPAWTVVSPAMYGTTVTAESMETSKFARPIPSKWHNWYVDLRRGRGHDSKGDGLSPRKACATVTGLLQKLNHKQQGTGIPLYGVIWDVRGVPVQVLDVPLDTPLEGMDIAVHSNVTGTPHTIQWLLQHLELAGEPMSQNALLNLAHEIMPHRYRELTAAEVCQEHDLLFSIGPGFRLPLLWQEAPARMWHSPGSRHFIFCRHEDAPTKLESPEIRLLNHSERISRIEKLLTGMSAQLKELTTVIDRQTEK